MTKSAGAIPENLDPTAVEYFAKRASRHDIIIEGNFPTIRELMEGSPFFRDTIERDIRIWCGSLLEVENLHEDFAAVIARLRDTTTLSAVNALYEVEIDTPFLGNELLRLRIYGACLGDPEHVALLKDYMLAQVTRSEVTSYSHVAYRAVAEGLTLRMKSMTRAFDAGCVRLFDLHRALDDFKSVHAWHADGCPSPVLSKTTLEEEAEFLQAGLEDRAEFWRPTRKMIVVPALPEANTSHVRELQKPWKSTAGIGMPLAPRGDVAGYRNSLTTRWPHAVDLIDTILGDLAISEDIRFRPTLLVGPPGSGKTALCEAIAEAVGVASEIVNLAGSHDASAMGTSAQWSTARESVPLQAIRKAGIANPLLVWDEVEKASPDRRNGSVLDGLLAMLEPRQAKRYRDPALEVECDLSGVSHFATANDLTLVPGPLRDRMRVLIMPQPTWLHAGQIVQSLVDDLMFNRGVDPRWAPPFAQDEMELIRKNWSNGSLRQLKVIVKTLVDGREKTWGQA